MLGIKNYLLLFKEMDQACFVGVQLVIRSVLKYFPYQILLNTPHHSCTPMRQTWSKEITFLLILENYTLSAVSRPLSDWSPWSLRPGTSRPQRCTPCKSWTQGPARTRCESTRSTPRQSCVWPPGSTGCCRWRPHRCKSRVRHTAGRWSWSCGTRQSLCASGLSRSQLKSLYSC